MVVPPVNLDHFEAIPSQQRHFKTDKDFLVCNSSCAVIGLVIAFATIESAFGPIGVVSVVTEQAFLCELYLFYESGRADSHQVQAILAYRWIFLTMWHLT